MSGCRDGGRGRSINLISQKYTMSYDVTFKGGDHDSEEVYVNKTCTYALVINMSTRWHKLIHSSNFHDASVRILHIKILGAD